ncbi:MAG: NMD3-related protein [Candidatus Aenigmatarchaeota archaeon]
MREKFCPRCGKRTEKLYEGFCESCFLSRFSFAEKIPAKILVKECKLCGKFFLNKSCGSMENLIETFLQNFLKEEDLTSISYRISDNKLYLNLLLKINNLEKKEEKVLDLVIKKIICQACSMKASGYFQAILQVRAPPEFLQEIKEEIEKQMSYLNQYDNLAFISKLEETKNGFDVFVGSKNSANEMARLLKTKYKAKLKITRKLAGRIRGKKVYRDTILISISSDILENK